MEEVKKMKRNISALSVLGVLLIAVGLLIFVDNFNILTINWFYDVFNWQVVLIVVGAFMLCDRDSRLVGWILIALGGFFLLIKYIRIAEMLRKLFWPCLLVTVGFILIFSKRKRKVREQNSQASNLVDNFALLGSNKQKCTSQNLLGGRITCIMGASKVSLLETKLAENNTQRIKVTNIMGNVQIAVPPEWRVKIEATTILGSINDKRTANKVEQPNPPVLVIGGTIIAGDCKII